MIRGAGSLLPLAMAAAVVALPAGSSSPALAAQDAKGSFHANITVEANSSLFVRETIEVVFTSPRHGLVRDIPASAVDRSNTVVERPLTMYAVTDGNDRPLPYTVTEGDGFHRIQIGDPAALVEGRQIYVINYGIERTVLRFKDHDSLRWDVAGVWDEPIAAVSARVTVEAGEPEMGLRSLCSLEGGPAGPCYCQSVVTDRTAEFTLDRPLTPGERFIVTLIWVPEP